MVNSKDMRRARFGGLVPHNFFFGHPPLAVIAVIMGAGVTLCTGYNLHMIFNNPDFKPNFFKPDKLRERHNDSFYYKNNKFQKQMRVPIPVIMRPDGSLEFTDYSRFNLPPTEEK